MRAHHRPTSRGRALRRSAIVGVVVGLVAATFSAMPAQAAVTTPSPGATVSGNVTVTESRGGTNNCTVGNESRSRLEVRNASSGAVVHEASRSGSGSLSTTWDSAGDPLGTYRIRSWANDSVRSGFLNLGCTRQAEQVLSDFTVTLHNAAAVKVELPTSVTTGESLPVTVRTTRRGNGIDGQALGGRQVTLSLPGVDDQVVTTGANGVATTTIDLPDLPIGTATVSAHVAGDAFYGDGAGAATTELTARPTVTRYTGATRAQPGTETTLSAVLLDATPGSDRAGLPVPDQDVFLVFGANPESARTDQAGVAARSFVVGGSSRTEAVRAEFPGGTVYGASRDAVTFYVGDIAADPAPVEHGVVGGVTRWLGTGLDNLLKPLNLVVVDVVQQVPQITADLDLTLTIGDIVVPVLLPLDTASVLSPAGLQVALDDLLGGLSDYVATSGDGVDLAIDSALAGLTASSPLADLYETIRFRWRAVYVAPDGTTLAREFDATMGLPVAIDVTGDDRADIVTSLTLTGSSYGTPFQPMPRINAARLPGAPAELPLSLQAVIDLPGSDEEYRFGYDTREGNAPRAFRADLVLAGGGGAGVQLSTDSAHPIAVTGAIRPAGSEDAAPLDPTEPPAPTELDGEAPAAPGDLAAGEQRFAITFDKAPEQARLGLQLAGGAQDLAAEIETAEPTVVGLQFADDTGGDQLLLADGVITPVEGRVTIDVKGEVETGLGASVTSGQGLDTVSVRAIGLDAGRTDSDILLALTDVPDLVSFTLGADGTGGLEASGPIGGFEAGYATGGALELLDDPAYLRLLEEAERTSVAVRLPGFEGMTVSLQDDIALDLVLAPTPLRALVTQGGLTLDAQIDDAPRELSLGLSPSGGMSVEGSAPIDSISVVASSPDGILSGASELEVQLTDVPQRFAVELTEDGVGFDTGGQSVGLVELAAHNGTAPAVPGDADGLLLDNRGGATALAARIHGLREIAAELDETPQMLLDTVAGNVFTISLLADDASSNVTATIDRLVPQMRLALTDDGATRLTYSAAEPTNSLVFDIGGMNGSIAGPLPAELEICMAGDESCLPLVGIANPALGTVVFKASEYTTLNLTDPASGLSASDLRLKRLDLTGDINADTGGPVYLNTTDFGGECGTAGCERPIRGGTVSADLGSAQLRFTPGNGFSAVDAVTQTRTRKLFGQTIGLEGVSGTGIVRCNSATALSVTVSLIGIPITLNVAEAICGVTRTPNLTPPAS